MAAKSQMIDRITPADLRAMRLAAGLTQAEAGALCHRSWRAWQDAERGVSELDRAALDLFLIRIRRRKARPSKID